MNKKKKICLITPNHIATNPRLIKEGIAFSDAGFDVHIIFSLSDAAGKEDDFAILKAHPDWTYDVLDWSGKRLASILSRFGFGLVKKLSEKGFQLTGLKSLTAQIVNRNYYWQLKKAITAGADLYIAHNLGALPVAKAAAKKRQVKYGFDAEDFHRYEISNDPSNRHVKIKVLVEESNIPSIHHFTAASPLIGNAYHKLFPGINPLTILNVFPKIKNQPECHGSANAIDKLKLFWFSQTIGGNRGLETVIEAMGNLEDNNFELHILGNGDKTYMQKLKNLARNFGVHNSLFFYPPVQEAEIFKLAATCDIGLASETGIPYNRDICLTNKIFTYLQSGLVILASDTRSQAAFMKLYPHSGRVYKKENVESLTGWLSFYNNNRKEIKQCKRANFALGQTLLNWEMEKVKLLESITSLWL